MIASPDAGLPRRRSAPRWLRPAPFLPILLLVAACGRGGAPAVLAGPQAPAWSALPSAARVYYDNSGGVRDSLRLVVRDEGTLRAVWMQATAGQPSPPAIPAIDFQREMLLVVGAGRRTPEDQIRIDSLAILRPAGGGPQALTAIVRQTEGCRRFNVDAYPLEIVRIARFDGPVEFVERHDRANCSP